MSANRHLGRVIALQTLYEVTFRVYCGDKSVRLDEVLKRNKDRYESQLDDKVFLINLVNGVSKETETLDKKIGPIAPDWPLDQIAKIDLCILRMAAYELLNMKDVPPKVVINEAVELAKSFGGDNSSKFINGVLGTLLKELDPKAAKSTTVSKAKVKKSAGPKA